MRKRSERRVIEQLQEWRLAAHLDIGHEVTFVSISCRVLDLQVLASAAKRAQGRDDWREASAASALRPHALDLRYELAPFHLLAFLPVALLLPFPLILFYL